MTDQTVTMSNKQFQALFQNFHKANLMSVLAPKDGNFLKCASRFIGNKGSDVVVFIDAIEVYKDCINISNANALPGLSMLLDGFTASRWQGVKDSESADSWTCSLDLLRLTFGAKKPPHRVYRKVFSQEQDFKTPTDVFVCKCILTENTRNETIQLDMCRRNIAAKSPVFDAHGFVIFDTGAKQSVASESLYRIPERNKQRFVNDRDLVKLADGSNSMQVILSTTVDVRMVDRVIQTKFIVLPYTQVQSTLLGIDFIQDAQPKMFGISLTMQIECLNSNSKTPRIR
ncbi:hypothetical protein FQA39_LY11130 [Lamprigera yunnana]|nr:hypothetical protein FQA39_LY11130 [Lamprigera yunnana]